MRIVVASSATSNGTGTITDSAQSWTTNEWTGYTAYNVDTGETDTIATNTATALTLTGGTMSVTSGDRYQIQKSEVTARYIYAAEMSDDANVNTST